MPEFHHRGSPPPRPTPAAAADLELTLVAVPAAARAARTAVRGWLQGHRWPEEDADDVVLAVNEAVANVIDHAYPPGRPGNVHLEARVVRAADDRSRSAQISVTDRGSWNRAHRTTTGAEHRGHGLAVMGGCVAEVHLQRSPAGTSVLLVSFPAS